MAGKTPGLFVRLWRALRNKKNPVGDLMVANKTGRPERRPRDYKAFAEEGYQGNVYVFRGIQLRGAAVGGLKWMVFKKGSVARRKQRRIMGKKAHVHSEEVEGHQVLKLLQRPNKFQGRAQFFEALESYLMISGNCYIAPVAPVSGENKGKPRELWLLRPDRVEIMPSAGTFAPIGGYQYRVDGSTPMNFGVDDVLHLRRFHPLNDFYGMSPLEPGGLSVDMNTSGRVHNNSLLQNGATPSGAMTFKNSLTPDQREQIKKQLADDHGGPEKAGSLFIFEGDAEWEQMSLSPKDMHWLEGQRMSAREALSAIGVPPELVGEGTTTYTNKQEARKSFFQDTVVPEADFIRDELNNYLMPLFGDEELDYDRDAIEALRDDREKTWAMSDSAFNAGTITLNESRAEKGFDDEPNGDYYVLPMTVRPAGAPVTGTGIDPATGHPPAPDPTNPDAPPPPDDEPDDEETD